MMAPEQEDLRRNPRGRAARLTSVPPRRQPDARGAWRGARGNLIAIAVILAVIIAIIIFGAVTNGGAGH